jgi:hypothetical protein
VAWRGWAGPLAHDTVLERPRGALDAGGARAGCSRRGLDVDKKRERLRREVPGDGLQPLDEVTCAVTEEAGLTSALRQRGIGGQ